MAENTDVRVYGQGRFNVETLAALARWMDSRGNAPRTRSDLLYQISEILHAIVVQDDPTVSVSSKSEALQILRSYGITWGADSKGFNQMVTGLSLEALSEVRRESSLFDDMGITDGVDQTEALRDMIHKLKGKSNGD